MSREDELAAMTSRIDQMLAAQDAAKKADADKTAKEQRVTDLRFKSGLTPGQAAFAAGLQMPK